MELRIVINHLDPPSGHAVLDGHSAWTFAGWLELIEKVERLRKDCRRAQPDESNRRHL